MNVAVVDIGSNSTRLLVADDRRGPRHPRARATQRGDPARRRVDADGRLRDDAMQRVYATLDEYEAEIDAPRVRAAWPC